MVVKIPKKVVNSVMNARCDVEGNKEKIEKVLLKLPFCKDGDTSLERLEKVMRRFEQKNDLVLAYIMRYKNEDLLAYNYSLMVKGPNGEWIETAHSVTIWEGFAKLSIFLYYYVQNGCKGGRTDAG